MKVDVAAAASLERGPRAYIPDKENMGRGGGTLMSAAEKRRTGGIQMQNVRGERDT